MLKSPPVEYSGTLTLAPRAEKNAYALLTTFHYIWKAESTYYRITVPEAFLFEASIPRVAWSLLGLTPGHPRVMEAACVHDYLYRTEEPKVEAWSGVWEEAKEPISREQADKLFFRIMRENGVGKYKRRAAFRAVRWFGGRSWKS